MSAVEPKALRGAAGLFATGVTIITCSNSMLDPIGMTANSFSSVSLDPPLVLWSVGKSARSAVTFKDCAHFAIHVLTEQQASLSNQFATQGADKFRDVKYHINNHGVPIIDDCLVTFHCRHHEDYDSGDHWIIVGLVTEITGAALPELKPLLFHRGRYAAVSHEAQASSVLEHGKSWMGMEAASWS
jgi:3-hydroxy-9,10-secoandrosta-1,3,5(10)-triene-9,17-dione monooxygenase reductase component